MKTETKQLKENNGCEFIVNGVTAISNKPCVFYEIFECYTTGRIIKSVVKSYTGVDDESINTLLDNMKQLQLGWCEDEKPVIEKLDDTTYICSSDSDYAHIMKMKEVA